MHGDSMECNGKGCHVVSCEGDVSHSSHCALRSTVATEGAVCPPHPVDEYGTCTGCGQKIDIAQQLIDAAQQDGLSEFLRATIKSAWCEIKDLRTAVSQIAAIAKEAANA